MIWSERIHRVGGFIIRASMAFMLAGLLALVALGAYASQWPLLVPAVLGIVLVLVGDDAAPRWAPWIAAGSIAVTLASAVAPSDFHPIGALPESGALLVLLTWSVRRWRRSGARPAAGLIVVALILLPARGGPSSRAEIMLVEFMLLVGIVVAVGLGAYLYSVDARRSRALADVRRSERIDIARDLHDFVAHHVTGVVVRAQAARYIADGDTAAFRETLADIERSAVEALTSMRRLVGVIRDEDAGDGTRPVGDIDRLRSIVADFTLDDGEVSLYIDPEVIDRQPPPEIAATILRVAVEALTNVRKHAGAATRVSIAVTAADGGVETAVRDNGGLSAWDRLAGTGGGYGLVGLRERVGTLGGRFEAGPRPEGGWQVVAWLPRTSESREPIGGAHSWS